MVSSTKLLCILAVVLMHLFFPAAFLQKFADPRWVLFYVTIVSFYSALYFRRFFYLRRRRGGVYRALGYTAIMLGAFLSALFFFSVHTGMALPLTIGVWFGLAIAFYYLYLIITLHLEEDFVQAQVDVRPPV